MTGSNGSLVVGVDAGASSTRCVVASTAGTVLARGSAGGANQNSSADPVGNLTAALREALRDLDPSRVDSGVFGIAGAGAAGHAAAQTAATDAWRTCGLAGEPRVVTDIAVAFAAGSTATEGTVMISGTGAVAAAVRDAEIIHRCDGYGWLLGDDGSAVWLGREAARAALAAADGRGDPTALLALVARTLLDADPPAAPDAFAQQVIATVRAQPPAELGRLAPLVDRAAGAGDAVANRIAGEAATRLLAAARAARAALTTPETPTVLAGSVLRSGPVADAVRAGLEEECRAQPLPAGEGAAGAAALALRQLKANGNTGAAHRTLLDQGKNNLA